MNWKTTQRNVLQFECGRSTIFLSHGLGVNNLPMCKMSQHTLTDHFTTFGASRSGDRQILCSSERSIDGLRGYKMVKGSIGTKSFMRFFAGEWQELSLMTKKAILLNGPTKKNVKSFLYEWSHSRQIMSGRPDQQRNDRKSQLTSVDLPFWFRFQLKCFHRGAGFASSQVRRRILVGFFLATQVMLTGFYYHQLSSG